MNFYGLQKLTLLDYPKKTACTLFTGGCNFRCPFCHNALLVTDISENDIISEEEILSFLEKRRGLLDGVCVTGGEPLLQGGLEQFLEKVKRLGFAVKIDTNGSFPERLEGLINGRLCDYVAVDIKNSGDKYPLTVGLDNFDIGSVERTVELLKKNSIPYEFRTTVVKELHDISDIEKIAKWIAPAQNYFLQQFKDSGGLISGGLTAHTPETLRKMAEIASKYIPNVQIRGVDI